MMRQVDGIWWPDDDVECLRTISFVSDLDTALNWTRSRNLCFQAGGNCGWWAKYLSQYFDEVWTVEPSLENYLCLIRNVPGNVKTFWAALGDKPGTTGLHIDPKNIGANYLEGEGRIPVITIDELNLPACDLLILDVEGFEPRALAGAKETLARFKPVLEIEDRGLTEKFGTPKGWTKNIPDYWIKKVCYRDVILLPK